MINEQELINELKKESVLLREWVYEVKNGGWSTQHVRPMLQRATEIESLLFKIS